MDFRVAHSHLGILGNNRIRERVTLGSRHDLVWEEAPQVGRASMIGAPDAGNGYISTLVKNLDLVNARSDYDTWVVHLLVGALYYVIRATT
jgi:hypothetical protein